MAKVELDLFPRIYEYTIHRDENCRVTKCIVMQCEHYVWHSKRPQVVTRRLS
jgi:hypothetical protein